MATLKTARIVVGWSRGEVGKFPPVVTIFDTRQSGESMNVDVTAISDLISALQLVQQQISDDTFQGYEK